MADWPPKESVFNPFFRRFFTNERARELEETAQLYAGVRARHAALTYTPIAIGTEVYRYFNYLPAPLQPPLCVALDALIKGERYIFELPEPDIERMSLKEFVEFRTFLRTKEYFFANSETMVRLLTECLVRIFGAVAEVLPQAEDPSPFTIPMIYALPDPKVMVTQLFNTLLEDQYYDRGILRDVRERMYLNLCDASGIVPNQPSKKPYKHASDSDLPLGELNVQYLSGTPFHDLFLTPVPLKLTYEDRFSHMHVVGGSGAGKTQLLQHLILHDLQSEDPPALVIVDSQTDLINKLSHLALFDPNGGRLSDRLLYITPRDIQFPPALNIFDVNRERLGQYDEATKEQVTAGVIQTFDYLFSGLLGADLTAKQGVFFRFVARLMLALPETMGRNATILDLIALMDDATPYKAAIASLPPIQRNFFERDFPSKTFAQTKEQIRYRLNAILENPTLARLFTSPKTKIDLFTALNSNAIVLVDTAKDFLKGSSSHFGRIFISLVLQAVLERAALPEHKRKPAFLIVDEAAAYFDSNIDDLLTEARKYKLGCVFAHQYLDQCTPSLRASLAANTSLKFASGLSTSDARFMAPDMRTTTEFILSQPRLNFACHIRNVTPQAVSVPIPFGRLEGESRIVEGNYRQLIERNRARVSLDRELVSGSSRLSARQSSSASPQGVKDGPRCPEPASETKDDPAAPSDDW
jgi:hypothetical protein